MKKKNVDRVTWRELNAQLLLITTDEEAKALLAKTPSNFKARVYSRYSKLRRARERKALIQ